jgi:hypothetical protein
MTLVLDDNQMKKAIRALISHSEKVKESGATRQLFEDEGDVFNLQIALKKVPEKVSEKPVGSPRLRSACFPPSSFFARLKLRESRRSPDAPSQVRIELPHSLFPANGEICLIVKDPQRVYKDRVRGAQPVVLRFPFLFCFCFCSSSRSSCCCCCRRRRRIRSCCCSARSCCSRRDCMQVKDEAISGVSKVVGISKLRTKFKQ